MDTTVRRGYLTLHRNGRLPQTNAVLSTLRSKRMWMVLCREGINGRPRIEMYRSEDNVAGHQPLRTIDIGIIRSIKPVEQKKGFMIELLDETMMLRCTSKADMEDWVWDMNRLRGGVDSDSGQNLTEFPSGQDIYEVVPDDETFRVRLRQSGTLNFSGRCRLEILRDFDRNLFHIALFTEEEPPRLIVQWQIDHIRQYGSNNVAFKFQSGGKSCTGVDWFIVDTEKGAAVRIHKAVDYWAKHIVDQIKGTHGTRGHAPSRPPRSNSTHSSLTYAPLTGTTMEPSSVYQQVGPSTSGAKRPVHQQNSSGARTDPGSGVYQELGKKDDPSQYATVSGQGGGAAARGSPTSPDNATYMGLQPDTRQPSPTGTYMVPDRK